jgi:hypothetical protein
MVKVPNCNAIVDGFSYTSTLVKPNYTYFLTHMHSDHYKGLCPSWNRGPIYCSPETAILLKAMYPGIKRIYSLELNVTHWIILDNSLNEGINVTLLDANHCIGSVMILFQGEKTENILYTGDFRYDPSMLSNACLLDSSGNLIEISHLFLDNTFNSPDFVFPSQTVCKNLLFQVIEENPLCDVWIKNECFGRESLLIELSYRFNTLIVVDPKAYERVVLLNAHPERFSTNEKDGFIHVVNSKTMSMLYDRNQNQIKTIGIWLTGWCKEFTKTDEYGVIRYKIPYSGHSNYEELREFTKAVQALKVTFTSSCAKKQKGNIIIAEETYKRRSTQTPKVSIEPEIVKRVMINPQASTLKKVKKPRVLGAKIL